MAKIQLIEKRIYVSLGQPDDHGHVIGHVKASGQ